MPPKQQAVAGDKDFDFIMSVFMNCEGIKPDWVKVATQNGLRYARNMAPKLNGILKKHGYKFENGTIIDLDGDADDADATAEVTALKTPKTPNTPKTPKTPKATAKAGKTCSFGKKRSAADMEADSEFNTEAAAGGKIKGEGEGEGDKYDGEAASGGAGEA